ncbi:unnamed protein product [Ambrosiozyma monospora]|uniref:Unnamed protein product n=1 Tax=Ambrosiozyma monospora TaxID=43982 RepID=A0A9W6Z770_AMBMO|nr:unnamed protein product [Ambrosiozyma monospora]
MNDIFPEAYYEIILLKSIEESKIFHLVDDIKYNVQVLCRIKGQHNMPTTTTNTITWKTKESKFQTDTHTKPPDPHFEQQSTATMMRYLPGLLKLKFVLKLMWFSVRIV